MIVVGFAGVKGSGKDTAGDVLVRALGFKRYAFAGPIKRICRMTYGLTDDQVDGPEKDVVDPRYGVTPRHLIKSMRGARPPEFFVNDFKRFCESRELSRRQSGREDPVRIVVTDVCFPHEVAAIRELGGRVFHVVRPGRHEIPGDPSERPSNLTVDAVIQNGGTLNDLISQVFAAYDAYHTPAPEGYMSSAPGGSSAYAEYVPPGVSPPTHATTREVALPVYRYTPGPPSVTLGLVPSQPTDIGMSNLARFFAGSPPPAVATSPPLPLYVSPGEFGYESSDAESSDADAESPSVASRKRIRDAVAEATRIRSSVVEVAIASASKATDISPDARRVIEMLDDFEKIYRGRDEVEKLHELAKEDRTDRLKRLTDAKEGLLKASSVIHVGPLLDELHTKISEQTTEMDAFVETTKALVDKATKDVAAVYEAYTKLGRIVSPADHDNDATCRICINRAVDSVFSCGHALCGTCLASMGGSLPRGGTCHVCRTHRPAMRLFL